MGAETSKWNRFNDKCKSKLYTVFILPTLHDVLVEIELLPIQLLS